MVSIIPGIDARAPERTLTSSGALGSPSSPEPPPTRATSSTAEEAQPDFLSCEKDRTKIVKPGGTGSPSGGHLRKSALAPEQVPARRISLCFAFAERETKFDLGAHSTREKASRSRRRAAESGTWIFAREREEQLLLGVVQPFEEHAGVAGELALRRRSSSRPEV